MKLKVIDTKIHGLTKTLTETSYIISEIHFFDNSFSILTNENEILEFMYKDVMICPTDITIYKECEEE